MYTYTIVFDAPNGATAQIDVQGETEQEAKQSFCQTTGRESQDIRYVVQANKLLPHENSIHEQLIGMSELSIAGASAILHAMHELLIRNEAYIDSSINLHGKAIDLEAAAEEVEHIKYMDSFANDPDYFADQMLEAKEGAFA